MARTVIVYCIGDALPFQRVMRLNELPTCIGPFHDIASENKRVKATVYG
jgi:hypothetical protein